MRGGIIFGSDFDGPSFPGRATPFFVRPPSRILRAHYTHISLSTAVSLGATVDAPHLTHNRPTGPLLTQDTNGAPGATVRRGDRASTVQPHTQRRGTLCGRRDGYTVGSTKHEVLSSQQVDKPLAPTICIHYLTCRIKDWQCSGVTLSSAKAGALHGPNYQLNGLTID